jgi:hypothetical protein
MKLQDLHPFNETILGLENLYMVDYVGNIYFNSPAIIAPDKTISTGRTYILVNSSNGNDSKLYTVELLDVYFEAGFVHLNVQDIKTQRMFTIDLHIECTETRCPWILIDMDYLNKFWDYKTIQSYCEKCTDSNGNSIAERNTKPCHDDLLEFEF